MSLFKVEFEYFGGEVKVISGKTFEDERGHVSVTYLKDEMHDLGIPDLVREIHSRSSKNVIRGLHYQFDPPMGKLMRVVRGKAFLVAVDFNQLSPTFLEHHSITLDENSDLQVWASAGFARGFCAMENKTEVLYKCSNWFSAAGDSAIYWDDPFIDIKWPVKNPILSARDMTAPTVCEYFGGNR